MSECKIVVEPFPDDDENADEWAPYIEGNVGNHVALLCTYEDREYAEAAGRWWSEKTGIPFEEPEGEK